jgi:repressor LexA
MTAFNASDQADDMGETVEVDEELAAPGRYALRVTGDSLIDLGIFDGDRVVVDPSQPTQKGDLVVVLSPREDGAGDIATIKVFSSKEAQHRLLPANPRYQPIPCRSSPASWGE